jgi:hypothetical protein
VFFSCFQYWTVCVDPPEVSVKEIVPAACHLEFDGGGFIEAQKLTTVP